LPELRRAVQVPGRRQRRLVRLLRLRSPGLKRAPLFPSLAALVTETGGILSHAAIVAREYGLPAVVGVAGATKLLPPGVQVRVDGTAGTVEIR